MRASAEAEVLNIYIENPRRDVLNLIAHVQAVEFREVQLVSGKKSPVFFESAKLALDQAGLAAVGALFAWMQIDLQLPCQHLCGVPHGAVPFMASALLAGEIESGLMLQSNRSKKPVEGNYKTGEQVLLLEDVATTGGSILQSAQRLREAGLCVKDVLVLVDRDEGAYELLKGEGINLHFAFSLPYLISALRDVAQITDEQEAVWRAYRQAVELV